MAGRHRLRVARHVGERRRKAARRTTHHRGHPVSEETRKKIAAAEKGHPHPHKGHKGKRPKRG